MSEDKFAFDLGENTLTEEVLETDVGHFSEVLLKFFDRDWRGDVFEDFINRLLFPIFPNNIEYISFIFDGGKGRGKTKKLERTAEVLVSRILLLNHTYNIIPVRSISIAHQFFNETDYQIVLIDDPIYYDSKLKKEAVQNFNRMRHNFAKHRNSGVLIILWALQDSFAIGKLLRKDLSGYIFVDWPSDESDQRFIKRFTHPNAGPLLKTWTEKLRDDHIISFKSRCIITTESWCGYASFDLPQTEEFQDVEYIEPTEETISPIQWEYKRGDYRFKEIARIDVLSLMLWALANYEECISDRKKSGHPINEIQKLKHNHIEAFQLFLEGATGNNMANHFGISRPLLYNKYKHGGWFAIFKKEFVGHLVEWMLTQEGAHYEGYKIIAGTGRVDLLSPDKKKAIEVKSRDQYEKPKEKMLSGEMKQLLDKEDVESELCMVILNSKSALAIISKIAKIDKIDKKIKEA